MSKQIKNTVAVLAFFDQQVRITERPILLTKSEINRPDYKFFFSIFAEKWAVKSLTRPCPRPRI